MPTKVLTVLAVACLVVLALAVPIYRIRRAFGAVIKIFQVHHAVDTASAKTMSELGLKPQNFFDRVVSLRDFRPNALQALIEARIVRVTEDERFYLSEQDLVSSNLRGYKGKR